MKFDPHYFYDETPKPGDTELRERMKRRRKLRQSLSARLKHEAMDSIGMKRVRGAQGGTYYE
jgi:hypothetical protein